VASKYPRVQVTVDPALDEAMAAIDPHPKSKSRLIRDLALRGAEVAEVDRQRREEAKQTLRKIVNGEIELNLDAAREAWEERETMPCKQPPHHSRSSALPRTKMSSRRSMALFQRFRRHP